MAQGKNLISHFQRPRYTIWVYRGILEDLQFVTRLWLSDLFKLVDRFVRIRSLILHVLPASKSYYFTAAIA